ncbi:MAG: sigma-54-dependent Fis family transcriptional regulator [Rhodospirillales bacterium]|nr:sigma-54-dependent Fis family transcriptional regulator [Rhodospirillales bacterium]MCB9973508.1 sigma-54-dependent Fis family transcriptional regulator [Rhodospirillales bacterium]
MSSRILIVEDDPLQQKMLAAMIERKLDYSSVCCDHGRAALDFLSGQRNSDIRLIIMDLDMPVMGGKETLQILKQQYPSIPVIMLTGSKDIDDAVDCMKLGAIDFLTKPYEGGRMMVTVRNAIKLNTLSKEINRIKSEQEGRFTFRDLIGYETGLRDEVYTGRKAAASDIPVLINGETGTGKEVFAKAIHGESLRAGKPFVAVNCGAIPSQLVESTLFGHEKGSFTGAVERVIGKFREAEGGTIFLDEVGELPLETQVKLLRVLQQKEVEPVGAGKSVAVDVRIISATNRNLEQEVKDGRFREDLFFRLNVLQIKLPDLRGRREDIPMLALHFIERFAAGSNRAPKDITDQAMAFLKHYDWPGNVRQLENVLHRAIVIGDGPKLDVKDFATTLQAPPPPAQFPDPQKISGHDVLPFMDEQGVLTSFEEIEKAAIRHAMAHFDHNITQAAKALGIAKSTFYKKLKTL